jgi:hypothetical protein
MISSPERPAVAPPIHELTFGGAETMDGLFGEDSRSSKVINTFNLYGTYRIVYQLKDGRIARVTDSQHGYSSKVQIWDNYRHYASWERNDGLLDQDIEGRGGRNFRGMWIASVMKWMELHPGEEVPTDRNVVPELYHYERGCLKCEDRTELHSETVVA